MDLTEGSETSAKLNLTPGKYPKENIQDSEPGEIENNYFFYKEQCNQYHESYTVKNNEVIVKVKKKQS
jgi:hypothetical protein